MSKTVIILGDRSDIAKGLAPFLEADGWTVHGWHLGLEGGLPKVSWDLFLCMTGRIAPVNHWWKMHREDVADCVNSNLLMPLELFRSLWQQRNPGASACFMAGSNPQKIMAGYLPYNMSKMALLKAVEQIDYESPDCKVFALGPGYVKTKIHKATLKVNWPNERIARGDDGTPIERIWECLKWCISQPKEVVGGRNIAASDPWDSNQFLSNTLASNPSMYKLRRME